MTRHRTESTPLGEKIRLLAVGYASDGNKERAEGLAQAAALVDQESALLSGKALVDALGAVIRAELEEFVADVVAALRSEAPVSAPQHRPRSGPQPVGRAPIARAAVQSALPRPSRGQVVPSLSDGTLMVGERRCLVAIAQHHEPVTREQLSAIVGYKRSTRDLYLQRLERRGFIARHANGIVATPLAIQNLGADFEKLPTGAALLAFWLSTLPEGESRTLEYIATFHDHPVHRERVGDALGYRRSTRDLYLQRLERRKLIEKTGSGHVVARPILFDKPSAKTAARMAGT